MKPRKLRGKTNGKGEEGQRDIRGESKRVADGSLVFQDTMITQSSLGKGWHGKWAMGDF